MKWASLVPIIAVVPATHALLRFACSQLVTERLDPLVTPGQVSPHVHQIIGGNAFNITMDPKNDLSQLATCTTCKFKENKSNYWTAVLYFRSQNGTFTRVPQFANQFTGNPNGGMTVYYMQPIGASNTKVTAFPKGFRMIVGNPMSRSRRTSGTNDIDARAITFRCWGANYGVDPSFQHPGTGPLDTVALPAGKCAGGIRSNIFFPSCWNGKDLDPPDHASHMAYTGGTIGRDGLFFHVGTCPASHPTRMPILFLEIAWDTRQFNNQPWPTDGSQPFVFSYGDPTGYGQHADYVFGWEGDALQRAMDTCTDIGGAPGSCRALTQVSDADMNRCTMQSVVNERVEGAALNALPGCNPIQAGPNQATMIRNCDALSTTGIGGPVVTNPPVVTTNPPPVTQVPPPATNAPGPVQTRFGQCGGTGWTGPTQCVSPYACQVSNQWYSQCV